MAHYKRLKGLFGSVLREGLRDGDGDWGLIWALKIEIMPPTVYRDDPISPQLCLRTISTLVFSGAKKK